ncbi:hypothetical protein [Halosimplex sp. TS25]|uniref:hypothetical protein n=1 Tax=Halosimplex rarum TaxID=3396619 RepID=UPI0039EC02F6
MLENIDATFLQLPNVFDADPAANEPFVLSNSFIPEQIGGSVRVVHKDTDRGTRNPLETENLNQMLSSFLPGGFKKRWQNFDLWQGHWDFIHDQPGTADIEPMFDFDEAISLDELLGDDAEEYTVLDVDIENTVVYVPSTLYVQQLPRDAEYHWSVDFETIVASRNVPGRSLYLGRSDPTTNYLWFRHLRSEVETGQQELPDENDIVTTYSYDADVEFLRCYYTSLLTIHEQETNQTLSKTLDYIHGGDDARALVASSERSQLIVFEVERPTVRTRVERVLQDQPSLYRDLQFAKVYRDVWDRLFFQEGLLENVFDVEPFVNHLVAVDYRCRTNDDLAADSVFEAEVDTIRTQLEQLLEPGDELDQGALCMMGYDAAHSSDVLAAIETAPELVEEILTDCTDDESLLDFGEEVLVHSVEHALSTWTSEEALASGSFELWYDVNFQGRDDTLAQIGIYDSIQGGAGIADEVYEYLSESTSVDLDSGLASQAACHTAATDRAVLELLASGDGETLYELFQETSRIELEADGDSDTDRDSAEATGFQGRLVQTRDEIISGQPEAYNLLDLTSHIENRVQALFETREIARFNAYVASEHERVETEIERTPRAVDLLLHLHQHIFRDPRVRDTYRRFANDAKGRDLSELGERLEELTLQCVTACPDCLETEGQNCLHGMKYQTRLLNRRLLREVCSNAI